MEKALVDIKNLKISINALPAVILGNGGTAFHIENGNMGCALVFKDSKHIQCDAPPYLMIVFTNKESIDKFIDNVSLVKELWVDPEPVNPIVEPDVKIITPSEIGFSEPKTGSKS